MLFIEKRIRNAAYVGSGIVFFAFLIAALYIGHYKVDLTYIVPTDSNSTNYFLVDVLISIGIAAALSPIAIISFINFRYMKSVERNIPRFLRDILQSTDSGQMLPKALIEASKHGYGPVSQEIGIAMTKFTLGYDFGQSIMEAAHKLKHPFAPQVGVIISEAYASGGKTHEVLSSSVSLFNDLEQYSEEKQTELKPYTQLVYISVAIFLVIAFIMISQFLIPLTSLPTSPGSASAASLSGKSSAAFAIKQSSISYYVSIFFFSGIFESLFAGIVAGKIVDSSAGAGLRHSLILMIITIVAFALALSLFLK